MKKFFLFAGLFALVGCQPQPNITVNPATPRCGPNIIVAPQQPPVVRPGINIEINPGHPHCR